MLKLNQTYNCNRAANLALVLVVSMALPLFATSRAEAGTYKMYTCNVPGRETPVPTTAPWTATLDGVNTRFFDNCASGGAFGIALNQGQRFMRRSSSASLVLMRPATGPKAAIGIVRYRTWITGELSGSGAPAFVSDGGALAPPGGTMMWTSPAFAITNPAVYVQLYCSTGAPGDCFFDSAWPLQVGGIETELYENVPPTGTIDGGTLLEGTSQSGVRTLLFSAIDRESGVARVEALLGDTVVATENLIKNQAICPQSALNACPSHYTDQLSIDTALVGPGDHVVSTRITDAAGNVQVVAGRRITVVRSSRAPVGRGQLAARFTTPRTTYITAFNRFVRVRGRLTDASGQAIPRARVAVLERPEYRMGKSTTAYVLTKKDGTFEFVTSRKRPSRVLDLHYYARSGDTSPVASRRLRVVVRAAGTLKVRLRGIRVRYYGRVLSRPLPRGGKRVYVQGRAAGGAWRRFAVHVTDRKGRFAGRYRLRVRRPGVQLQFRLEITKQTGYPFSRGLGRVVKQRVT